MSRLGEFLYSVYRLRDLLGSEQGFLSRTLRKHSVPGKIMLDVGCGFASYFEIITNAGLKYVGTDLNADTVAKNRELGRDVYLPDEIRQKFNGFDVIMMSHVIEHMDYGRLVEFINEYSKLLRPDGLMIVFSPLLSSKFYDDFDHVKPYNPSALRVVLCRSNLQTQEFGIIDLFKEVDLWIKRDQLGHFHSDSWWTHLLKVPLLFLYLLSFGLLGTRTGFGMVFKKQVPD